jgi:hypothetical protein
LGQHGRTDPPKIAVCHRWDAVDRLNEARSLAGTVILIGMIVCYSGLSHLATTTVDSHGARVRTVTAASPEGHWIVGVVVSVTVALFLLPLASLALVLWAEPGFRRATLYQLRWPVLAIAAFTGLFAAMTPTLAAVQYLTSTATRHLNFAAKAAGTVVSVAVALVLLVWLVKALYFAATGVVTEFGGPLSITVISVATFLILRKRYQHDFPFLVARLHPAVRRRVLLLTAPTVAVVVLVRAGFQGFLVSSPRFWPPVLLTFGQWGALLLVPPLVLAAGAALLRRYERELASGALLSPAPPPP